MGVRWSDDKYARRVDHPAFGRRVGSASSMGPGGRTATETGARHPHAATRQQRAQGVGSAARPDPRPLRWPLYVGAVLLAIGVVSFHHEDDLLCAEKSCEVTP